MMVDLSDVLVDELVRVRELERAEWFGRARDSLSVLVEGRLRFELVADGGGVPCEMPLVEQLELCVASEGSGTGAAGVVRSAPVDLVAVEMRDELLADARWFGERAGLVVKGVSLVVLLRGLLGRLSGFDDEMVKRLGVRFREWAVRLDDYFYPKRRTPLDVVCPECGYAKCVVIDDAGDWVRQVAVVAVWSEGRVTHFECRCCKGVWLRHEFEALLSEKSLGEVLASYVVGDV